MRLKHMTIAMLCLVSFPATAQEQMSADIARLFAVMPDSLCPYLTMQQRHQLMTFADAGYYDTIPNVLEGKTVVTGYDKTANVLDVQITPNMHWQMTADGQITMTETICAPRCARNIYTFDLTWHLLRMERQSAELETEEERIEY